MGEMRSTFAKCGRRRIGRRVGDWVEIDFLHGLGRPVHSFRAVLTDPRQMPGTLFLAQMLVWISACSGKKTAYCATSVTISPARVFSNTWSASSRTSLQPLGKRSR